MSDLPETTMVDNQPLEAGQHDPIPVTDENGTPLVQVVEAEKSWPQAEAIDGMVYAVTDPEFGTRLVAMTQKTFEDMTSRAVTLANEIKRLQLFVRSMERGKRVKAASVAEISKLRKS